MKEKLYVCTGDRPSNVVIISSNERRASFHSCMNQVSTEGPSHGRFTQTVKIISNKQNSKVVFCVFIFKDF